MLAPSAAAFNAIAKPIPREAPVIKSVFPANFLKNIYQILNWKTHLNYLCVQKNVSPSIFDHFINWVNFKSI